jgi:hypothetical protein
MAREEFLFLGKNLFSCDIDSLPQSRQDIVYQMIVNSIISGAVTPRQRLPVYYHNLIVAEAIKGVRNSCVVEYLELK